MFDSVRSLVLRLGPRVLVLALLFSSLGCSAAVWEGVAAGLAAASQTAPTTPQGDVSEQTVCVKYETRTGWSKGYKVTGHILRGSELNRRTGTWDYNALSTYVVVFWGQGEASVLELQSYFGSLTAYGHDATDQRGRKWQVSSNAYCY